jgi:hypothetical protein
MSLENEDELDDIVYNPKISSNHKDEEQRTDQSDRSMCTKSSLHATSKTQSLVNLEHEHRRAARLYRQQEYIEEDETDDLFSCSVDQSPVKNPTTIVVLADDLTNDDTSSTPNQRSSYDLDSSNLPDPKEYSIAGLLDEITILKYNNHCSSPVVEMMTPPIPLFTESVRLSDFQKLALSFMYNIETKHCSSSTTNTHQQHLPEQQQLQTPSGRPRKPRQTCGGWLANQEGTDVIYVKHYKGLPRWYQLMTIFQ